ncbi:putative solute carrier family 22 member 31 [Sceloporus undulatus]|uniref:putative solute carrier family 22 member 31 n=1 Tax=Sceloporus undulatus TaxID=8520 RepID=UPI001C4D02DE|nr:putative solute carrier family 22 member 31 [Sceloporus undulatus]
MAGLWSTVVTQWDLVCSNRWKVPLEEATFLLGWLLGFLGFGSTCDRLGRRTTFVFSLMLSVPLGITVSLALNYVMFSLAHMLFGAVLAGAFLSLYVARLELCDPPQRLTVSMSAGFFWVAGELLLPGLAVACKEWRLLQGMVTLALALVAICCWCPSLSPESVRWLLATQQLEEGRKVLRSLADSNGIRSEDDLDALFAELDNLSEGVPRPKYYSVCQIFCTRVVWKNSLILGFTAFIGSGIRHSFTRNLAPYAPRFYFPYFLQAVSEALVLLFLCLTVDRFGRRAALLFSTILTGVSSLLLLALTQYMKSWLVLALSVLGILSSQAVTALSILFASEVLPTVVRGAGLGLILAASSVGCLATPLMAIHNSRGFFLHHVVFASFTILSVLSIMLLPETNQKPLPDSLHDGENQRRPPLFRSSHHRRRSGRQDHLPLLSTRSGGHPYDPESYARLVTATKKMLGSSRHGSGSWQAEPLILEPSRQPGTREEM